MAAVPCILEPPSPALASPCSTTGTPKSRFRFPFYRRKSSSRSQGPSPPHADEEELQAPSADHQDSHLNPSPRRQSGPAHNAAPARSHGSQRLRSRRRDKIVTDPPPFAQVRGQALLNATLESPVSYWERPKSRRPSLSPGAVASRDVMEATIEVKRSHRRTDSGQSCCSTRSKIFFLVNGAYVMQYDGDSEGDALPEKILVLDKDSMACVCDAVPGHPWVLQIVGGTIGDTTQAQTLRPSWSRLSLRQTDKKRAVNLLLLIFDESEDLRTWLHAIRKEIEHLGGTACGQGIEEDNQSWKDDLTKKFAAGANPDSDSDNTATSSTLSPFSLPLKLNVSGHLTTSKVRPQSTESATSSKKTSTSLDRLRDSGTSYSCTSTLATSSAGGSPPSTSPDCEHFPSIKSVTDHLTNDLCLRSYSLKGHQHLPSSSAPGRSILERRKLSVDSLHLAQPDQLRAHKIALSLPSPISASPNDISPHVTDPLPGSDIKIHDASMGRTAFTSTTKDCFSKAGLYRLYSDHKDSSRNDSPTEAASGLPKIKYSLFPAPSAPEAKPEAPRKAELTLPGRSLSVANAAAPKHGKSRSRTVTLELRQHRISTLLAAGAYDLPQRSPAATDDMILSNFGIARNDTPASPLPDAKVPALGDLYIDLDFLKGPYREQPKQSSTPASRRGSAARSISSVHSTKGPAGPPPVGPLPAVPAGSRRSSRTQRSSQHSQHSQQNLAKHDNDMAVHMSQRQGNDKVLAPYVKPPTCEPAIREPRQRHRRTISSSLDAPLARLPCKPHSETKKTRSRSRSRGRRKSGKQQS